MNDEHRCRQSSKTTHIGYESIGETTGTDEDYHSTNDRNDTLHTRTHETRPISSNRQRNGSRPQPANLALTRALARTSDRERPGALSAPISTRDDCRKCGFTRTGGRRGGNAPTHPRTRFCGSGRTSSPGRKGGVGG